MALSASGIYAWGFNVVGQLGNDTFTSSSSPVQVVGEGGTGFLTGASNISDGVSHSLAATPTGVFAWGDNYDQQLGNGSNVDENSPVLSANFQPVSVFFGSTAGTALSQSGSSWTVTSPAGNAGAMNLTANANIYGGTVAGSPADLS